MSLTELFSFILASTILAFTPGPDNIFVIVTSLGHGFKTSLKFILGLCTGIVLHTALIVLGVSTLISQSKYGLLALKYFAVSYLLYLAVKTFKHRNDKIQLNKDKEVENYFLRGFIMNISNPKILMFFLAFLPQFANMDLVGFQNRLIILGSLFILVTFVVFSSIAWVSVKGGQKFIENPKYSLYMNWLAIAVFVGVSLLFLLN
ncbi:MAG: LysE family translocator [Proteobacteria bacterium]|nr:LysE family translocator [Pseudomonadota bacterium]